MVEDSLAVLSHGKVIIGCVAERDTCGEGQAGCQGAKTNKTTC